MRVSVNNGKCGWRLLGRGLRLVKGALDSLGEADGAVRTAAAFVIAAEDVVRGAGTVGDRLADHELAEPVTDTDNHRFVVLIQQPKPIHVIC